jgi:U2-associated protein SR140
MAVTSVWEQWLVFNNTNVEGWIKTFLGRVEEDRQSKEEEVEEKVVEKPVEKKGKWKSVTAKLEVQSVVPPGGTSVPLNAPDDSEIEDVAGKSVEEEDDVDGKPMEEEEEEEEDVDGEPMEEEDVDGVPMDEDDDVDGEPMEEEDIDGLPMDKPVPPAETLPISPRPGSPPQSPHRQEKSPAAEILPPLEAPRPQKRQRMRAADMFND